MNGDYEVNITVTSHSVFELLPRWAQWALIGITGSTSILLFVLIYMTKKGLVNE